MQLEDKVKDKENASKYRAFRDEMVTALKGFEGAQGWAEVMKCLTKVHKVLENKKYVGLGCIPEKLTLCKRLSQCLNPMLPQGVHQRALDVFSMVFQQLGPGPLALELPLYSSGLFPFFQHASTQVKPRILEMYQKYYLSTGPLALSLCVDGLVASILCGMEEENSPIAMSTSMLLDSLCTTLNPDQFLVYRAVWNTIYHDAQLRCAGFNYLKHKMPKSKPVTKNAEIIASEIQLFMLGDEPELVWSALSHSIRYGSELSRRSGMDMLVNYFRIHESGTMDQSIREKILTEILPSIFQPDATSLHRRLYNWVAGEPVVVEYFNNHSKHVIIPAFKRLLLETKDAEALDILYSITVGPSKEPLFLTILPDIIWEIMLSMVSYPHPKLLSSMNQHLFWNGIRTAIMKLPQLPLEQQCKHLNVIYLLTPSLELAKQPSEIKEPQYDLLREFHNTPWPNTNQLYSITYPPCICISDILLNITAYLSTLLDVGSEDIAIMPLLSAGLLLLRAILALLVKKCNNDSNALAITSTILTGEYVIFYGRLITKVIEYAVPLSLSSVSNEVFTISSDILLNLLEIRSKALQESPSSRDITNSISTEYESDHLIYPQPTQLPQWLNNILYPKTDFQKWITPQVAHIVLSLLSKSPILHSTHMNLILEGLDSITYHLWQLMGPEHAAQHPSVVPHLLTLHKIRKTRTKEYVLSEILDKDRNGLRGFVRLSVLWNYMDIHQIGERAFTSCMLILLDGLKSEDPALCHLSRSWLVQSLPHIYRLVDPLLYRLVDHDRPVINTPLFDHRRAEYVVNTLLNIIETAPRVFVQVAYSTQITSSAESLYAKYCNVIPTIEPSNGRFLTGFPLPCHRYLTIIISTLLRMIEEQFPKFSNSSQNNIEPLYRAYTGSPLKLFDSSLLWDNGNISSCVYSLAEHITHTKGSTQYELSYEQKYLCMRSARCLRVILSHCYSYLNESPALAELSSVASVLTPIICLLLHCAVSMDWVELQSELLHILLVIINQLNAPSVFSSENSNSFNTSNTQISVNRIQEMLEPLNSVVFSYTILNGLLRAGLVSSMDGNETTLQGTLLGIWIDMASSILPLVGPNVSIFTNGLVHSYCCIMKHAFSRNVPMSGIILQICSQGLQQILNTLFSAEPISIALLGRRMTRTESIPGYIYTEAFPAPQLSHVGKQDTQESSWVNASPGIVQSQSDWFGCFISILSILVQSWNTMNSIVTPSPTLTSSNSTQQNVYQHYGIVELESRVTYAVISILDPILASQPYVLLRNCVALLLQQSIPVETLLWGSTIHERSIIQLLNLLPSSAPSNVVPVLVDVIVSMSPVHNTATPSIQPSLMMPSALMFMKHTPGSPIAIGSSSPEFVALWFLTQYISQCKQPDSLINCFQPILTAAGINSSSIFCFPMQLKLLLILLRKTRPRSTTSDPSQSALLEDPKHRKLISDALQKSLESAIKSTIQLEQTTTDPTFNIQTCHDPVETSMSSTVRILNMMNDEGILKILYKDDKEVANQIYNLWLTLSTVLKIKEDNARVRLLGKMRESSKMILCLLEVFPMSLKLIKKEIWEMLFEATLFKCDTTSLNYFKSILQKIIQLDSSGMYQDLISRYQPYQPGLFTGKDTVAQDRVFHLKRLTLSILAYPPESANILSNILDKFNDAFKLGHPLSTRQVFICLRAMFLKIPIDLLSTYWPTIIEELIKVLHRESSSKREVVLEALKYLEMCTELLPDHFHNFRWIFVGSTETPRTTPLHMHPMVDQLVIDAPPPNANNPERSPREVKEIENCLKKLYLNTRQHHYKASSPKSNAANILHWETQILNDLLDPSFANEKPQ